MDNSLVQYIIGAHWEKRIPVSIARSVRAKFNVDMSTDEIKDTIAKYTLRHHGQPVLRKNWPVPKPVICES